MLRNGRCRSEVAGQSRENTVDGRNVGQRQARHVRRRAAHGEARLTLAGVYTRSGPRVAMSARALVVTRLDPLNTLDPL